MFGVQKKKSPNHIQRADENLFFRGRGIVRFRPLLFLSLSFGLGIFFACMLGLIALVGASAFLLAAAGVLAYRIWKKKFAVGVLLFSALLCLFYALGCLSFSVRIGAFERSPEISGECSVAGTVEEIGESKEYTLLTLGDIWLIDGAGNSFRPNAKLQLYIYGEVPAAEIGSAAMFDAEVQTYDAWAYGRVNANAVIGNTRYRASAAADKVVFSEGEGVGVFTAVRRAMRGVLFANMDEATASVAYGMLTGDSGYMDEDALQNFRYGGIAHIFAVSGLHIGIIYGLLSALCKKCRIRNIVRVPLVFAALCFYAGVCGFSPSSVRALVMCTVAMLAEAGGLQYDRVGSVSCASLTVLVINPVYLFSVGFQLSVAAAAGIVIVGGHLTRLLRKIRFLPQKVCSAVGVAFSAQLATFPILIDCFGYVSGISFFLNLVFVPVIGAVYSVLFCAVALSVLLQFAAPVFLFIPGYLLRLSVMPIVMLEFKVLLICGFSFGSCAVLWYLFLFFLSDKVNLKPAPKISFAAVLCALLIAAMMFQNFNIGMESVMTLHAYYGSNIGLIRSSDGDYLIVYGEADGRHIEQVFLKEGITELRGAIFLTAPREANTGIPVILQYAELQTVYVPADSQLIDSFRTVEIRYESGVFAFGDAYAQFFSDELLYLNIRGAGIVCDGGADEVPALPECDLLIANTENDAVRKACSPRAEVYFEKTAEKMSVYRAGDLQIGWKNDIISVKDAG